MGGMMSYCDHCRAPNPSRPCGECGGTRQHLVIEFDEELAASGAMELRGTFDLPPPMWQQQWDRLIRAYDRLPGHDPVRPLDVMEDLDAIYWFFQNCHHLKDWLKADAVASADALECFINAHDPLVAAAHLCNGSKHFRLDTRGLRNRANPAVVEGGTFVNFHYRYVIRWGDDQHDLLDVALECVRLWRSFLEEFGVFVPQPGRA